MPWDSPLLTTSCRLTADSLDSTNPLSIYLSSSFTSCIYLKANRFLFSSHSSSSPDFFDNVSRFFLFFKTFTTTSDWLFSFLYYIISLMAFILLARSKVQISWGFYYRAWSIRVFFGYTTWHFNQPSFSFFLFSSSTSLWIRESKRRISYIHKEGYVLFSFLSS